MAFRGPWRRGGGLKRVPAAFRARGVSVVRPSGKGRGTSPGKGEGRQPWQRLLGLEAAQAPAPPPFHLARLQACGGHTLQPPSALGGSMTFLFSSDQLPVFAKKTETISCPLLLSERPGEHSENGSKTQTKIPNRAKQMRRHPHISTSLSNPKPQDEKHR